MLKQPPKEELAKRNSNLSRGDKEKRKTQALIALGFFLFLSSLALAYLNEWPRFYILLNSENPISFLPLFIPIAGTAIFYASLRAKKVREKNNWFLRTVVVLMFLLAYGALGYFGRSFFEKYSLSLFFLPFLLSGGIILIFGFRKLLINLHLLFYGFFLWPQILIFVQAKIAPVLVDLTTFFTLALAKFFSLPLTLSDPKNHVLLLESKNFAAVIGTSCSGSSSLLAVIILIFPMLFIFQGKIWKKIVWFLIGPVLALVGNIVRTYLIFYWAQNRSEEAAIGWFHSTAGLALFGVVFFLELVLLSLFKLKPKKLSLTFQRKEDKKFFWQGAIFFLAACLIFGFLSFGIKKIVYGESERLNLQNMLTEKEKIAATAPEKTQIEEKIPTLDAGKVIQESAKSTEANGILENVPKNLEKNYDYEALNEGLSRRYLIEFGNQFSYLPPVGNLDVTNTPFTFGKQLFGEKADYQRFKYQNLATDDLPFFVDVVVTPDKEALLGLAIGYCYRYHGYKILFEEKINAGHKTISYFYSYLDNDQKGWESIDFTTPVYDSKTGEKFYRRIKIVRRVLYGRDEDFSAGRKILEDFTYQLEGSLYSPG